MSERYVYFREGRRFEATTPTVAIDVLDPVPTMPFDLNAKMLPIKRIFQPAMPLWRLQAIEKELATIGAKIVPAEPPTEE